MTAGRQATEYFFNLSLFLFVTTGFIAVSSTGKLDTPTVLIVAAAIGLRGLAFLGLSNFRLSPDIVRGLTVAYIVFYVIDYFLLSGNFVSATGHLLFFLLVMKLFSATTNRDYLYLGVIAFMEMLLAAILTISALFFGVFTIFLLFGIATFTSFEIKRGFDLTAGTNARSAEISSSTRAFQRGLGFTAAFVTVGVLIAGAVLFFTMPRYSAGYLSALAQAQTISGFSNSVTLGEIGSIKQSTQVVMHVKVTGGPSNMPVLRWRGRGLMTFNGKNWSARSAAILIEPDGNGTRYFEDKYPTPERPREILRYTVTVEPMRDAPIFLAPRPVSVNGRIPRLWFDEADSMLTLDSFTGLHYDAVSDLGVPPPSALRKATLDYPRDIANEYLQLPDSDPRFKQLALQLTANAQTEFDKAAAIELYLRTKLGYTLEMKASGPEPVADFLFSVKQGHCEYFASAMTILLRSIGIPARPVNGFLGGELNDITQQYVVRGSDAHTWVEVFFPGFGWMTFDPTPSAGTDPGRRGLGAIAKWIDAMRLFWTDWVVSFDFGRQLMVFRQMDRGSRQLTNDSRQYVRSRYDALRMKLQSWHDGIAADPMVIPLAVFLIAIGFVLFLFAPRIRYLLQQWRSRARVRSGKVSTRDVTLAYERFLSLMARRGIQRSPATTPSQFVAQIDDPVAHEFTVTFEEARYGGATQRLPDLYRLLAKLEHPDSVVK